MKMERKMLKTSLIGIVVLFCAVAKACLPPPCTSCWDNWPDCDTWRCTTCEQCSGGGCVPKANTCDNCSNYTGTCQKIPGTYCIGSELQKGSITQPTDGSSVASNSSITLSASGGSDSDCYYYTSGDGCFTCSSSQSDSVTASWTARWKASGLPAGTFPGGSNTGTSVQWQSPSGSGEVEIIATWHNENTDKVYESHPTSQKITVTVVSVQKIQYNDRDNGWTDITGTLYAHKDGQIEFKAIKSPENASWPDGKPVWGGTSGASGTGETKTVTFNTVSSSSTDYKTVTTECGNTVSVNVIVCEVEVTDIKFDHNDSSPSHYDALNIRENNSTDINVPEWVNGGQNKPAAYIKSLSDVDIKARFSITPAVNASTKILATTGSSILGNINEVAGISFISGSSGYVRFTASGSTPSSVNKGTVEWQWKINDFGNGDDEININTSGPHTVYTVLDAPKAPQVEPWADVLDKSCVWASNKSSPVDAAGKIVDEIFSSGYQYDNVGGAARYYDSSDGKFKLTTCLSQWGSSSYDINCWDCANMVCIFSNALGCNLNCYLMIKSGGFYLNYINPIGRSWTNDPFTAPGRQGFSLHWSAWSNIYDACLQVDNDSNPTSSPNTGTQPKNMTFNANTPTAYDDYRGKLVDPADETSVTGTPYSPVAVK